MNSRDIFAQATGSPSKLFGGEANVARVVTLQAPQRAWLGFDNGLHAVAYFESVQGKELNFAVSEAILIQTIIVEDDISGDRVSTIKVSCVDQKLLEVFYGFMDDVVERIEGNPDVLDAIVGAAGDWRSLLQIATNPLPESRAVGLYGEICFLEQIAKEIGPDAVTMWQRSERDVHDFIGEGCRVEVKCSSFQDRAVVTINGLRQLEPPTNSTLTLAVAEIQKHGGETIDEVLERVLALGVDRTLLIQKLATQQYVIGMPGADEHRFNLLSWRYWEIKSTTGVLNKSAIEEHIADAISSVSYGLNLSALDHPAPKFDFHRLSLPVEVDL